MDISEKGRLGRDVHRGRQKHAGKIDQLLAIKLLHKSERHQREVDILVKLVDHPNVIKIIASGSCEDTIPPKIYFAMELCLENLCEYVTKRPHDLRKATSFFLQIVLAIVYIHNLNIAHRDLKPSNILLSLDMNSIKVSDFGVSKELPKYATKATVTHVGTGTEGFRAPETYDEDVSKLGFKADIYPMAISGFFVITHGKHPFGPNSYKWTYNIMENVNPDLSEIPRQLHKRSKLIKLLGRMLEYDPSERPTAKEIRDDVFFTGKQNRD